jgi:hypothetical protein
MHHQKHTAEVKTHSGVQDAMGGGAMASQLAYLQGFEAIRLQRREGEDAMEERRVA